MQIETNANGRVFGLYELSNDGTILYSRSRSENGLRYPTAEFIGRDFFRDIAHFENTDDLRKHFRRFITSDRPVDNFDFVCIEGSEAIKTKVFLTRAHETDQDHVGDIVIMDIRQAVQ